MKKSHPLFYIVLIATYVLITVAAKDGNWRINETNKNTMPVSVDRAAPLTAGDLVITEIMHRPSAVTDAVGEYFEIYNTTNSAVDMMGMSMFDDGDNAIEVFIPLVVNPGEFVVFGPEADTAVNGGIAVDFEYDYSGFQLGDDMDAIFLYDEVFNLIESVIWDNGVSFPNPFGASISLDPESFNGTANDMGDNWCTGMTSYGSGDLGTPGYANSTCVRTFNSFISSISIDDCTCCDDEDDSGVQLGSYGG